MASLAQDRHYGLNSGNNNDNKSNHGTLFHVKLTDTAIRALEAFQNIKGSLQSEPSICFKGNQGYIKIPAPSPDSPDALRVFSFYLSSDSKDQPQASFDCIHQYVSSDGHEALAGRGSIQDKITVCATDDSYQLTRERVNQVEKDSWSRAAIEIKPADTQHSKCLKFQKRPNPLSMSESNFSKQLPNNNRRPGNLAATHGNIATPTHKPLRDRIIHLLALKPYRKPEILLWMERETAGPKDKTGLGAILEEVARVNPRDSSYLLKDDFYRHVQGDWPGYSEDERGTISRLLARKLPPHISNLSNASRNLHVNSSIQKTSEETTLHLNTTKNPAVKRPVPFDPMDRLAAKRQKLVEQRLQHQHPPIANGHLSNNTHDVVTAPSSLNPSFHTKTEFQRTSTVHTQIQNGGLSGTHSGSNLSRSLSSISDKDPKIHINNIHRQAPKGGDTQSDCAVQNNQQPQLNSSSQQHKKKKSKKHKDKDRERFKDNAGSEWMEKSPELKMNKLDNSDITQTVDSEEKPDYILAYGVIVTLEQRQSYQKDFSSEYDEYKDLHSRIATITTMFVQLASKIKSLSPGTQEYKIMEGQILEKYNKYRKKFPGYREEKKRCEYLHEKLSFIKQLITEYDVAQSSS